MFKKHKLNNGLRVILAPMQDTKAITVLVLFRVGSRYETANINGASHFVEHLMFKGTKKRPTAMKISQELDSVGAEYNAFTSKDYTGYYVETDSEHTDLALDVLSDIVNNSIFSPKEIERERGVIIEEINMYEDNPMMYIEDLFEQTMYGDHPLGWNIAGPREVIRRVTRKQLFDYYRTYYQPANSLVVAAGRLGENFLEKVKSSFGAGQKFKHRPSYRPYRAKQASPHQNIKNKETEQVQLALGFPAYSYFQEKIYPLYLLSVILGGNMSSRLFMSVREKMGLCYFIRASVGVYEDAGNFVIQAGLDKKRLEQAIIAISLELAKVKKDGITAPELYKAKEFLKGKLILQLESSDAVASWLGKQELLRRQILTPAEQIKRLEKVSREQVNRVAAEVINQRQVNLALIGPVKESARLAMLVQV